MGVLPGIGGLLGGAALKGQEVFTSSGSFVVPDGITSISAVCVGCGANSTGRGGDLRWISALAVTPGETLTVEISTTGGQTRIHRSGTSLLVARGGSSGTSTATGGVVGGGNGGAPQSGAGGAGGYSGNGGSGGSSAGGTGQPGSGGSGGGGGGSASYTPGGGGGVGLLGEGTSGAGGAFGSSGPATRGGGGSGGGGGSATEDGGEYGGGAVGTAARGAGACRIIWGEGRAYPSTNTGDV